jgi:hypothetical protein
MRNTVTAVVCPSSDLISRITVHRMLYWNPLYTLVPGLETCSEAHTDYPLVRVCGIFHRRRNGRGHVNTGNWLPGWGNLRWDSQVWFRVLSDSDYWVIALQIADPSSRQRGRPIDTRLHISDSNIPTGNNILSQVPQGCPIPRHTNWLTFSHKVTSTSTSTSDGLWRCETSVEV